MSDRPTIEEMNKLAEESKDTETDSDSSSSGSVTETTENGSTDAQVGEIGSDDRPTIEEMNQLAEESSSTDSGGGATAGVEAGGSGGSGDDSSGSGSGGSDGRPTIEEMNQLQDSQDSGGSGGSQTGGSDSGTGGGSTSSGGGKDSGSENDGGGGGGGTDPVDPGGGPGPEDPAAPEPAPEPREVPDRDLERQGPATEASFDASDVDRDKPIGYDPNFDRQELASELDLDQRDVRADPSGDFSPERTAKQQAARQMDQDVPELDLRSSDFVIRDETPELRQDVQKLIATERLDKETFVDVGLSDVEEKDGGFGLTDEARAEVAAMQFDDRTDIDITTSDVERKNGDFRLTQSASQERAANIIDEQTESDVSSDDVQPVDDGFGLVPEAISEEFAAQSEQVDEDQVVMDDGEIDLTETQEQVVADRLDRQFDTDVGREDIDTQMRTSRPQIENFEETISDPENREFVVEDSKLEEIQAELDIGTSQQEEENQEAVESVSLPDEAVSANEALETPEFGGSRTITSQELRESTDNLGERARSGLDDVRDDILEKTQPVTEPVVETGDQIEDAAEPVTDPIVATGDTITDAASPVTEPIGRFGDDLQDRYDQAADATVETGAETIDWTKEKLLDIVSETGETAIQVGTRKDVAAATLVGTTVFPGTPPATPGLIGRAGLIAGGAILTASAAQQSEIELPDNPDFDQSEIEQPEENPTVNPEQSTPEQSPENFESEISVPEGEEQVIAPEELGIPRDQVEGVSGGAEITEDGEIRVPLEATQVAAGTRFEDEEEEEDEDEDEEPAEEEIIIIEGPTGTDFLDEEEIPEEDTEESEDSSGVDGQEEEELAEIQEPEQVQGVDDIDPVDQRNEGMFEEPNPEPIIDPVQETQPEILQQQDTLFGTESLAPPAGGDFSLLALDQEQQEATQPELSTFEGSEGQVQGDGSLGAPMPDVLTGQLDAVAQDQIAQQQLTGEFAQLGVQQQRQGLLETEQLAQPQENLFENAFGQVGEGGFGFGQPFTPDNSTERRLRRPLFGSLGSSGSRDESQDEGNFLSGFEDGIAPGWLSETVADIATVGRRDDPITREQLESADLDEQAPGELPTAEFFGDTETQEDISEVQSLFGVGESDETGLTDLQISIDIDEEGLL